MRPPLLPRRGLLNKDDVVLLRWPVTNVVNEMQ
jgi:hypothetical protein